MDKSDVQSSTYLPPHLCREITNKEQMVMDLASRLQGRQLPSATFTNPISAPPFVANIFEVLNLKKRVMSAYRCKGTMQNF